MSTVVHVSGFTVGDSVREVRVGKYENTTVIEVARGVIKTAESDHTELVNFRRSWPLDSYDDDSSVVTVNAVTRTTLDGGKSWTEMWHYFGTFSDPWPTAPVVRAAAVEADEEPDHDLLRKQRIEDELAWGEN